MTEDAVAEGMSTDGMLSKGASAEGALAGGIETEGSGAGPGLAGAGAKEGAVIAGIVPVVWADADANGRMRITLSKMRRRGDICIYYLFIFPTKMCLLQSP
ncbi:MAG: hypothetical protein ABIN99_05015 [Nitrosospira sp.]